ncbi:MAG: lipopolysaccharide assembly protein LapA domain-containing protein [Pseudomonadota bacterium]
MHSVKIICLLILFALVAVFTFQNTNVAEIKFLLWSASLSISLMLLSALFAGIIIGLLLSFLNTRSKLKKEKKESSPIF